MMSKFSYSAIGWSVCLIVFCTLCPLLNASALDGVSFKRAKRASLHELLSRHRNMAQTFSKTTPNYHENRQHRVESQEKRTSLPLYSSSNVPSSSFDDLRAVNRNSGFPKRIETIDREKFSSNIKDYAEFYTSSDAPSYADPKLLAAVMTQADQAKFTYPNQNRRSDTRVADESHKRSGAQDINPFAIFPPSFHDLLDIPVNTFSNGTSYNPNAKFKGGRKKKIIPYTKKHSTRRPVRKHKIKNPNVNIGSFNQNKFGLKTKLNPETKSNDKKLKKDSTYPVKVFPKENTPENIVKSVQDEVNSSYMTKTTRVPIRKKPEVSVNQRLKPKLKRRPSYVEPSYPVESFKDKHRNNPSEKVVQNKHPASFNFNDDWSYVAHSPNKKYALKNKKEEKKYNTRNKQPPIKKAKSKPTVDSQSYGVTYSEPKTPFTFTSFPESIQNDYMNTFRTEYPVKPVAEESSKSNFRPSKIDSLVGTYSSSASEVNTKEHKEKYIKPTTYRPHFNLHFNDEQYTQNGGWKFPQSFEREEFLPRPPQNTFTRQRNQQSNTNGFVNNFKNYEIPVSSHTAHKSSGNYQHRNEQPYSLTSNQYSDYNQNPFSPNYFSFQDDMPVNKYHVKKVNKNYNNRNFYRTPNRKESTGFKFSSLLDWSSIFRRLNIFRPSGLNRRVGKVSRRSRMNSLMNRNENNVGPAALKYITPLKGKEMMVMGPFKGPPMVLTKDNRISPNIHSSIPLKPSMLSSALKVPGKTQSDKPDLKEKVERIPFKVIKLPIRQNNPEISSPKSQESFDKQYLVSHDGSNSDDGMLAKQSKKLKPSFARISKPSLRYGQKIMQEPSVSIDHQYQSSKHDEIAERDFDIEEPLLPLPVPVVAQATHGKLFFGTVPTHVQLAPVQ